MDELTLTQELGRETPLPSTERLAPARARLLAEVAAAGRSRRRRSGRLLAGMATLTAAAAAAVVALQVAEQPRPPELRPVAQLLDPAAAVAERGSDVVPRADQFVYVRLDSANGQNEAWYSIDGRHDGLRRDSGSSPEVIPGCRDSDRKSPAEEGAGPENGGPCEPLPYYLPQMPTEPAALIDWLERRNPGEGGTGPNVNGMGKDLWALGGEHWLRPAQRAALYRAVARIDGLRLVEHVRDGSGREGTGVAWAGPGDSPEQVMWIFDPKTYQFLGSPEAAWQPVRLVDRPGQTG
jgi:hypothetical protein